MDQRARTDINRGDTWRNDRDPHTCTDADALQASKRVVSSCKRKRANDNRTV